MLVSGLTTAARTWFTVLVNLHKHPKMVSGIRIIPLCVVVHHSGLFQKLSTLSTFSYRCCTSIAKEDELLGSETNVHAMQSNVHAGHGPGPVG